MAEQKRNTFKQEKKTRTFIERNSSNEMVSKEAVHK